MRTILSKLQYSGDDSTQHQRTIPKLLTMVLLDLEPNKGFYEVIKLNGPQYLQSKNKTICV
ncbi:hypothetical protein NC653_008678 [Populus alba x Populus x berolinensis]|uniref:Uncharacterized protein n=1 Tax=Populus alba x Populus x berolinensis TaxID=444605 RepID=A0AAD6R6Z6_9ROSI|nr:hypothetical protein NC653_008678 [Populus alba x Populus x berolinensis]